MANVKISDLPAATTFGATDLVPIVQSGVTKRVAGSLITATSTNVQTGTVSTIQAMIAANIPFGNGYMTASVASSAITIAIKTLAGTDATTTDAVTFVLRSSTITNGAVTGYALTGALTTVISSGSTLGCSASDKVRIHVGAMLNGSTSVELFYWTASVSTSVSVKSFNLTELISTTAEGGSGGADSSQTAYSTAARTDQPWTYLGYIEATSSATAGQWSSIDKIVNWQPGVPMPGDTIQNRRTQSGAVSTGTTIVPGDDTIPQITEGDQYMTQAITAASTINKFRIMGIFNVTCSAADFAVYTALFQDATVDALAAHFSSTSTTAGVAPTSIYHYMVTGTISETTFRIRMGPNQASTVTFNGASGARFFGGICDSYVEVQEIHA